MFLTKSILFLVLVAQLHYGSTCVRPNEVTTKKACEEICGKGSVCAKNPAPSPLGYCQCAPGTARDRTQTCVPKKDCKNRENKICGKHEEWRCDNNCKVECIPFPSPCPNYSRCIQGCYCVKGYLRDKLGNCVEKDSC